MKKTILSIRFILITVIINAQAPIYDWATRAGGSSDDYGHSITVDASGDVYLTGKFNGTVDFDPGAGTVNLTSAGADDVFISKSDAAGNLIWAESIGGTLNDFGSSVASDAAGNTYITGYFQGTMDFDPGAGAYNLTSAGGTDVFILKLDASGNFIWAQRVGGTSSDIGSALVLDASGNVYITGTFWSTADFDPGTGTANLTSAGNSDIFILKLDTSGNYVWAKNVGGTSNDTPYSITLDPSGNIYTTGAFSGTADFDPGSGTADLTASPGSSDIFILKSDPSGNLIWAKQMGGASYDYGFSISVDAAGNIYTTGNFSGTADFDPGSGTVNLTSAGTADIFISKLNSAGNFVWAKTIGGTFYDAGTAITTDASGNIYITGYFCNTVDFDSGAGVSDLISPGIDMDDVFILKSDSLGNFIWVQQMGGTDDDASYSIQLDASNNIYTTGYFSGTADLDPGTGADSLTSSGGEDIFVQKLSQTILTTIMTEKTDNNIIGVYPNPSNGFFNVVVSAPPKNALIEIYNSVGALILNKQVIENGPNLIQLVDQASGIYFIKVMADNKIIASKKIIKQ